MRIEDKEELGKRGWIVGVHEDPTSASSRDE